MLLVQCMLMDLVLITKVWLLQHMPLIDGQMEDTLKEHSTMLFHTILECRNYGTMDILYLSQRGVILLSELQQEHRQTKFIGLQTIANTTQTGVIIMDISAMQG